MRSESVRVAAQDGHAAALSSDRAIRVVDMGKIQHVEGQASGPALSVPGGISRSPCSIRRFVTHDSGAAMRASIREQMYKPRGRPRQTDAPFRASLVQRSESSYAIRCTSCKPPQRGLCGLGLSVRRAPRVRPRTITTMIRMHTMHRGSAATRAASRPAQPSQVLGRGRGR